MANRARSERDLWSGADGAISSHDGSFRIEELGSGEWELAARVGYRRSAPAIVTVPDGREVTTLVVPRGASVAGIVVDASGRTLARAEVHLSYAGEFLLYGLFGHREARTRTDKLGRFRIEGVQPGKVELMASFPELPDSSWLEVDLDPGDSREGLRLELLEGGRIEGSLDPSLGEIAHRQISLSSFDGTVGWQETESDGSGHFVFEDVIPQHYCISLMQTTIGEEIVSGEPTQVTTTSSQISKNLAVEAGRTTEVVFGGPERSIVVQGTITSAGLLLEGVEVSAAPDDGISATGSIVRTAADGRYELTVPAPGPYRFDVSIENDSFVEFARNVPDQDLVELSFPVPSGAISGRVVDAEGQPLRNVPITAVLEDAAETASFHRDCYRRMHTKDDGTFVFRLLAPGSYTLRAPDGFQFDSPPPRIPHGRVVLTDLEVGDADLGDVELRLPQEGRVSGILVDLRGAPVPDAWICLIDGRNLSLSGDWETHTDSTGHFLVTNVAPGAYTTWVQAAEAQASGPTIEVEAGKTASTRIELR